MNLDNPLHLLYITMPFDLSMMTIGFRQLVDRVSVKEISFYMIMFNLDPRNENRRKTCTEIIGN